MTTKRLFSQPVLSALETAKILGIRAGLEPHRFLGVWVVVTRGRVFIRSWNDKLNGWHRAFLVDPRGFMQLPDRELPVRARTVRGERLLDAIDAAYDAKYHTPASLKWVRGFRVAWRRKTTTELVPR